MRAHRLLLLLGVTTLGCGRLEAFPDGHTIDVPSNALWYAHWTAIVLLGLAAFVALGFVVAAMSEREPGAGALCLLVFVGCVALARWWAPSTTSPREQGEQAVSAYRRTLAERAEAQKDTPKSRIREAESAARRLDDYVQHKLDPLRESYAREHKDYLARLKVELPKTGAKSHAALLAHADEFAEANDLLVRTAVLERALQWLDAKRADAVKTLRALDQRTWMLRKLDELHEASPDGDAVEIAGIVAAADAIVDQKLDPPAKQDLARRQAAVFDRVLAGGAP